MEGPNPELHGGKQEAAQVREPVPFGKAAGQQNGTREKSSGAEDAGTRGGSNIVDNRGGDAQMG